MKKNHSKHVVLLFALSMIFTLIVPASAAPTDDPAITSDPITTINGQSCLLDPVTGEYLPVRDVTAQISTITAQTPRDSTFEQKFEALRKSALLKAEGGQVGYGVFYNSDFQHDFVSGSAISYDIICPNLPGGNVRDTLYLTATNRTAQGVEALIKYNSQAYPSFLIYDWSYEKESDKWVVALPYSQLGNYLRQKTAYGMTVQYITVQSHTRRLSETTWQNLVYLQHDNGNYDLVYNHVYTASNSSQKHFYQGSWGPIVETFQSDYSNTNPLGFCYTYIMGADSNQTWSPWESLSDSQSYIRNDGLGFKLMFLDPNYSFAVH